MRFAISVPPGATTAELLGLAQAADRSGWAGFFVWDHVYIADGWTLHDPWVLLGAIAAVTSRVRLGAMVTPLARRRPWKVAKEVITLDHLSSGRVIVGVGLGAPDEDFTAFGESAAPRDRAAALDSGLAMLDGFLRGDRVSLDGVDARLSPGCVQSPRPPIWVAATWPHRRPLARAARYDGVFAQGALDVPALGSLRSAVGAAGSLVVPFDRSLPLPAYGAAGVDWLVVGPESPDDWPSSLLEVIEAGPPGG